jgi:poly(beta-D-mannuronate) lyase
MLRLIFLNFSLALCFSTFASNTIVSNEKELVLANNNAKPGDTIILKSGNWENITLKLNCKGTKEHPIVFKAESKGKVIVSGFSKILLGGDYIVVDGIYFTNGFSGTDAVIKFSINSKEVANNCRVTNTVINDFNNPKRLDENYWVALYGKNNRIDHCSFLNKKNLGVLLAVILEDDRSRANFHSIDHNYFGFRIPLASNAGEMIRVGVSEHCEFNSNTKIEDNYFEKCDGETEIISIKSCQNIVRNNLFKECQGAVVLRHGNYNIIANNVFLGNDKKGTGGVRVINKGHLVVNNVCYEWSS